MADAVQIVEVGPRDGLQNESARLAPELRIAFIEKLIAAGLTTIEAGSFVSPKWVPQMAGTDAVLAGVKHHRGVRLPVLVPNLQGLEAAIAAGAREIATFAAASETFSQRNINCSIAQSLQRFVPVMARAKAAGIRVRGYVSCVLGCPYEGTVPMSKVVEVTQALFRLGCAEVSLGDTIGVGTPHKARALIRAAGGIAPMADLAVHFHDTYGQALANIQVCLEEGVRTIDAATGGIGDCPFAAGATGNVATEEVVYMLAGSGLATGVDLDAVLAAGAFIAHSLGRPPQSRLAKAMATKPHTGG